MVGNGAWYQTREKDIEMLESEGQEFCCWKFWRLWVCLDSHQASSFCVVQVAGGSHVQ